MKAYLAVLVLSSCSYDPPSSIVEIVNHTGHDINVVWDKDSIPQYPTLNNVEFYLDNPTYTNDTLSAEESGRFGWKRLIKKSKNKKVHFFIFNADSIKAYNSIDELILKRKYEKLSFSEDELEKLNWIVEIR